MLYPRPPVRRMQEPERLTLEAEIKRRLQQRPDATRGPILSDDEFRHANALAVSRQLAKPDIPAIRPDASARPGYSQPVRPRLGDDLGQRTIGPVRPGVVSVRLPELPVEELETRGSLGTEGYGLEDALKDALRGRGAFAPNKPGGALLDIAQVPAAARMGASAREQWESGNKLGAGMTAALAAVPVAGKHIDKALAVWKAGLLTNPLTHAVNVTGNTTMVTLEALKDIPAAGIDAVISAVRGSARTKSPSFRGLVTEQFRGVSAGAKAAKRVLREGATPEQLAKWDARQIDFGDTHGGKIMRAYTEGVFRSLGAEDALFKSVAMGRALEEYARLEAKNRVKSGAARSFDEALEQLRKDPPASMIADAMLDAEVATFQQDNVLASMWSKGREHGREAGGVGTVAAAAMDVAAPFVKTPTNIAGTLIQYSPAGVATALFKQIRNPSQKKLAEDLGRSITGSGLVWLGWALAEEGQATGAMPESSGERAEWALEGKQPNSVRLGDHWLAVSRLMPGGGLIAVGAQMRDAARQADGPLGAIAAAGYAPVRTALDQTFLRGASGALETITSKEPWKESLVEHTVGSAVPAVVGAVARGVDPVQRAPHGVIERVQTRIPFASRALPPRRDAFGREVPHRGGVLRQMFDIAGAQRSREDDLTRELDRLGVRVGFPSRDVTTNGVKRTRSRDDYDAFLSQVGEATEDTLRALIASPAYQELRADADRERRIRRAISRIRAKAREREREARTPSGQ